MKTGRGSVTELCYAAEGLSGSAAATSLRRLGSLMDQAPAGRLFGAISTLSDMSARATRALEAGAAAMDAGNDHQATVKLARALTHMDDLAAIAADSSVAEAAAQRIRKAR